MLEVHAAVCPDEPRPSLGASGRPEEVDVVDAVERAVDQLCRACIRPLENDRAGRIPPDVLAALAEMGLFGLSLPESHGGTGLSLWAVGSVVARIARWDRSVATTLGLHLGLGSRGLCRWGTPSQRDRYLPRLATGEIVAAFAATEPGAGSDLSALRCSLSRVGAALSLRGQKAFVTNGGMAGLYTVAASSPGLGGARQGQTLVLVERGDHGVIVGAEENKLGLRASSTTMLAFDDVILDDDRMLGPVGQGAQLLRSILAYGRTVMAFGCTGTAHAALAAARDHCAGRVQFGRPLDQIAVVREQLADMCARLFAAEAVARWAASDESLLEERSLAAKVLASDLSGEIVDTALQLHGGYGYMEETGVALMARDARITRIFEGANDVLRVHRGLFAATSRGRAAAPPGALPWVEGVAAAVAEARGRLGARLVGDSVTLHRLGSMAMLADAAVAVITRAEDEGTPAAAALAARWLRLSQRPPAAHAAAHEADACLGGLS